MARRRAIAAAHQAGRCQHLNMGGGQFIDEPAGQLALPLAVNPAVRGEGDRAKLLGACDADIGQTALFLEALLAAFVHAALAREQPLFPAGQEHHRKLQPLGGVKRHDGDLFLRLALLIVHDQRDVFEKALQAVKLLQRLDEFLQVFQPPRRLGRFVVLPHRDVAGFFKDDFGQSHMAIGMGRGRVRQKGFDQHILGQDRTGV